MASFNVSILFETPPEILLSVEEANLHQFRPNQTVWISAAQLHLFADPTTQVA
jgi:sulfate transport system ATP-binding protein